MKAADIKDEEIYTFIKAQNRDFGVSRWDIEKAFPQFKPKVVFAKLQQMTRKSRLEGCPCGCRGDFKIPKGAKT